MYGPSSCAQLITGASWLVNAKHTLCTHGICSLQFYGSRPENGSKKQTYLSEARETPIVHEWWAGYWMKTEVCPHKGDIYLLELHEKSILKSNQLNHTTRSEEHADSSWTAQRSLHNWLPTLSVQTRLTQLLYVWWLTRISSQIQPAYTSGVSVQGEDVTRATIPVSRHYRVGTHAPHAPERPATPLHWQLVTPAKCYHSAAIAWTRETERLTRDSTFQRLTCQPC